MRIKKTSETTPTTAQVVNTESNSTQDTYSCDKINEKVKEVYSTTEQVIGTWIDGKPLYRKTIPVNITTTSRVSYNHNITNIESIWVDMSASYYTNETIFLPFGYQTQGFYTEAYVNSTSIAIDITSSFWVSGTAYITLKYTKTTDTANT